MKHILVAIEQVSNIKGMLQKALKFNPEKITILLFLADKDNNFDANQLLESIQNVGHKSCETEVINAYALTVDDKSKELNAVLVKQQIDTVFLFRPHFKDQELDFSFIKATLKSTLKTPIFLCGDNKWRKEMKLLATIDILDDSNDQQILNENVLETAAGLSEQSHIAVDVLSVIPISSFKKELDITDEHTVLAREGEATKNALETYVKTSNKLTDYICHVAAGTPASEITSVASKIKANVVIMGSVGRTGLTGLVIGNTAEKILKRLTVDTLIVS
ncbi:universal stress protein [Paraglaciecola aquimarina]|uniref:Universal stress protein n=1 Tax=Paraglaciecola algarum TaxID=3050085 RepID=A0ABS9D616_9ALTE|nr:universal stress protein [Paraglaciecola sp. G1-23]MCF2947126.1 universal stress protein [Paraglaciecola sp. G1-23]